MLHSLDLKEKEIVPKDVIFIDIVAEGLAVHCCEIPKMSSKELEAYLLEQATQKFGLPASSAVLYEMRQASNKASIPSQTLRYAVHISGAGEGYSHCVVTETQNQSW